MNATKNNRALSLKEIETLCQCTLKGDQDVLIFGVADLESATPEDVSFYSNPRYLGALKRSCAGAIFVPSSLDLDEGKNLLVSDNPSMAFQKLVDYFHPTPSDPYGFRGIHPSAVIHETASVGKNVTIAPMAVIDKDVIIGDNTFIGAHTYIGYNTEVGSDCHIHPNVTIRESCKIGNRVIVQPGAVIGSCGFGYVTNEEGKHIKLNQVGCVIIEDDVEIGANTTIDRARFKHTMVAAGTKIDNLVQIGHGVLLGKHNILVSQVGIAGSSSTGNYVVLGGQVGVNGHVHLDDGVTVASKSGVSKSLSKGVYGGMPAVPIHEYNRNQVFLRNIEKTIKQLKEMFQTQFALYCPSSKKHGFFQFFPKIFAYFNQICRKIFGKN